MKSNLSSFLKLGLGLLVIIVAMGLFFFLKKRGGQLVSYINAPNKISFFYPKKFVQVTCPSIDILPKFNYLICLNDSTRNQRLTPLPDVAVRRLSMTGFKNFQEVLINDAVYEGSGMNPKSFSEFKELKLSDNTFYYLETGRFEGILSFNYYVIRGEEIIGFNLVSSPVDWTNPKFISENDLLNQELITILKSFKFIN
ncbi:MAG: hypothetical protein M1514_03850 [Patescibacteria group bacterium]|nr:hypothetical protein [Patescibacteria group bacterium]